MSVVKTCGHCKTEKPLIEFYKNKSRKDGLSCACKDCDKARRIAWVSANREAVRAANKRWAAANRDVGRKSARKFYQENKEYCKAYSTTRSKKTYIKEKIAMNQRRLYAELGDSFVCKALGGRVSEVPKELIEAKRIHLQIVRKLKELKA